MVVLSVWLSIAHAGQGQSHSVDLPDGMMFIGLLETEWKVFVVANGQLNSIEEIDNPSSAAYSPQLGRIAYIGSDGVAKELELATGTISALFETDDKRYTQPQYNHSGDWLYFVELPKGNSRQTHLVGRHTGSHEKHYVVRKRGAQFEPFAANNQYLYFTTASCVDDCPSMIWELWRRNAFSAKQEQLSLLNAVSRQPYLDLQQQRLWFSSDAVHGKFRIWSMQARVGAIATQHSFGPGKDSHPVVDSRGSVYFLRHSSQGAALMKLDGLNSIKVELPEAIINLRNLTFTPDTAN